jgi:hypothetical protein
MSGNFQQMMQQAQQMQAKMEEMQQQLADTEVEGSAGGGMITVRMTCKGEIRGIDIDDSLLADNDKSMLEDLIMAAANDARSRADARMNEETQKAMGELGLPADFKMPF